jgi:hypothetical protein
MGMSKLCLYTVHYRDSQHSELLYYVRMLLYGALIVTGHLMIINLVPRAFPFLSLGRREKALAPGGLLCILIGQ